MCYGAPGREQKAQSELYKLPSKDQENEIPDWWWIVGIVASIVFTLALVPPSLSLASKDIMLNARMWARPPAPDRPPYRP